MTPFQRLLRRMAEKYLGRFEEGENAPARIREQVVAFANYYPKATRSDWIEFASRFAGETYEAGYVRGVEWVERDPDLGKFPPGRSPEELADAMDPTWKGRPWWPGQELESSLEDVPPENRTLIDIMEDQVNQMKAKARRW